MTTSTTLSFTKDNKQKNLKMNSANLIQEKLSMFNLENADVHRPISFYQSYRVVLLRLDYKHHINLHKNSREQIVKKEAQRWGGIFRGRVMACGDLKTKICIRHKTKRCKFKQNRLKSNKFKDVTQTKWRKCFLKEYY